MQNWMPDIDGVAGPKYLAIAHAMMLDIKAGRLTAGVRLPRNASLPMRWTLT